jgi:hypothetical protein
MIVRETKEIDGKNFVYTYSDSNVKIRCGDVIYSEAYDPVEYAESRVYTETDIPIVKPKRREQ